MNKRGFTLTELMVALGVMGLLMLLMSQGTNAVSKTYEAGVARVDSFTQARAVLNVINRDLQAIVLRPDLAAFVNSEGDPQFSFYTRVEGNSGNRALSLVSYSLNPVTSQLQRNNIGFDFLSPTSPSLSLNNTLKLPANDDIDPSQGQPLAEGLIALKWQARAGNGTLTEKFSYDFTDPAKATNTQSIVVSLLVLDAPTYKLVANQGKLDALRALFASVPQNNLTYSEHWNQIRTSPGFDPAPTERIKRSLRTFGRSIILPVATVPTGVYTPTNP